MTIPFNNNKDVFLKIGREVPENDVNIAYFEVPEITPKNNIKIINEAINMSSNLNIVSDEECYVNEGYKLFYNIYDPAKYNDTFYSRSFMITDKIIGNTPVFFKHRLRYNHLDTSYNQVFENIKIVDANNKEVSEDYFYSLEIKELEGKINNRSRFEVTIYLNFRPGPEEEFYINYFPEHNKLSGYQEVLNPTPIFTRISVNNFFENYLDNPEAKVYAIEAKDKGFNIYVPVKAVLSLLNEEEDDELRPYQYINNRDFTYNTRKYYLSFNDLNNKIYASINEMLGPDNEWYLDINYDTFVDNTIDKKFFYNIPEFFYQDIYWEDGIPCRDAFEENAMVLDSHTIQLKNKPLFIRETVNEKGYVVPENIIVRDGNGKEYTVINWNIHNGKIMTIEDVSYQKISVEYVCQATSYRYNGYYDENGKFIHIDFNPRVGHFYTEKILSRDTGVGDIIEHVPSYQLTSKMVSIYLKPEYVFEGNELISRSGTTLFHTINHDLHQNPYHPLIDKDISNNIYTIDNIKLIARIFVIPITNPEKIVMIDTRSRGGGIKEGLERALRDLHPEVNFYWDIGNWNGDYYPVNGVVVIELPKTILSEFTHEEILAKIEKHLALGVLPVVKYI